MTFHRAFWVVLGCCLLLAGCISPPEIAAKAPPTPLAHLVVRNLTEYEWRITVTRASGESLSIFKVKPQDSATVDLAGGDCEIEQTVLSDEPTPELTRRIPMKLTAGETYHWRLVTLLSDTTGKSDSH